MDQPKKIPAREVTEESVYLNRRAFTRAVVLGASVVGTGWLYKTLNPTRRGGAAGKPLAKLLVPTTSSTVASTNSATNPTNKRRRRALPFRRDTGIRVDPQIAKAFRTSEKQTSYDDIHALTTTFTEFSTDKDGVRPFRRRRISSPGPGR